MIPVWKSTPFIRLLLPFMAGILCGWYVVTGFATAFIFIATGIFLLLLTPTFTVHTTYRYRWLQGCAILLTFTGLGMLVTRLQPAPQQPGWFGHLYRPGTIVQLRLLEPLSERLKTFKARAEVMHLEHNNRVVKTNGEVIVYFQKENCPANISYGTVLYTGKKLDMIKNSGNPGGFDYQRHALFKGITHQVYLKQDEFITNSLKKTDPLREWLYATRTYVLQTVRKYIKGKQQRGVAEALLVGYRDDLDSELTEAYSNTGVVHIIAISGMHLGMIYVLFLFLLRPLEKWKELRWIKALLILLFMWLFGLLTGGGASIMRAVIMFSFITAAQLFNRRTNLYNSLAASAFLMLLFNPFLLWDVGFQLSYAAVLSIVLFMKPIYQWFTTENKLLDSFWKLNAVTIAAQVLTWPLCMYHFHQSPNLFLLANMVAVPLSTLILYALLVLLSVSFSEPLSSFTGTIISRLLNWMNDYILWLNRFRFSVWEGIYHTPAQTVLLYLFITCLSWWLLRNRRTALYTALGGLLLFLLLHLQQQYLVARQVRLIVYNLPQHQAIDFFAGQQHYFLGDSVLLQDGFLRNFHLKPARILYGTFHSPTRVLPQGFSAINWQGRKILVVNQPLPKHAPPVPLQADLVIISKNPRFTLSELQRFAHGKLIVFDSSNPLWKVERWKKESDSLHLPHFSTTHQGAFVMNWR